MKSCFFIGHRDAGEDVKPVLAEAVERHITQYGVTGFTVRHYGNFDSMAAQTVKDAKKRHPEVTLELLLPVFLDLYDLDAIQAFAIEKDAEYTIRDYTVSVYQREGSNGLNIEATGQL